MRDHQFGFRKGLGTFEQLLRVAKCIKAIDENNFSTAMLLYIPQAFGKVVWSDGLLFKLSEVLP